ncbi:MAG TPA: class I tRNA ligase family protein, partial [Candidatus Norongarragalinales archaeon]|nr:class I tRNA ligase family protein [Candidatus Norongarragalinales archaeon]
MPILPGPFIDMDHATGFVHSVPAHAPFDLVALEDLKKDPAWKALVENIQPIPVITVPGFSEIPTKDLVARMKIANLKEKDKLEKATAELYKKEFYEGVMLPVNGTFSGLKASDAKEKMASWLKVRGVAMDIYESSRKAQCRCGARVVAAVLPDQWFIDFNAPGWKENARRCLKQLSVFPEVYKKQFEDVFAWLDKRPCARRRGLGTRLPFNKEWIIESLSDSTLYLAFYPVIKKIRELKLKPEQLNREFFDYVYLGKSSGTVSDEWQAVRTEFLYWYPLDHYHTAVAHLTNHLSFFIFAHAGLLEEKHWPKLLTLNELVVSEGTKMSKSKGNVVSLNDVAIDFGADLFRLYSVSAAELGATLDFRKKDIEAIRRRLERLYSLWDRMLPFVSNKPPAVDSPMTRWALSKFANILKKSTLYLQDLRLREYALTAFFEALNVHEHVLDRCSESEQAYVFSKTLVPWIHLLSPLIPHASEEFGEKARQEGFVSIAPWPQALQEWFNPSAESQEDFLLASVEDIQTILRLVKKKPSKITLIVSAGEKLERLKTLLKAARAEDISEDS